MDARRPVEAIARKMIRNVYNGDFSRKTDMISDLIEEFHPDGVIHYCHWGCKQSSGGVMLLRDGQLKTRLEAFLEMVKNRRSMR